MQHHDKYRWILGIAAALALVAATSGCHPDYQHGEAFADADATRHIERFGQVEVAHASRQDATLRAYHFDGAMLNTLGQERLDQMVIDGDVASTLVLYMDVPEDAELAGRQQAVSAYLKDRGLKDEQIRIENGPNPKSVTPVAPTLPSSPTQQQEKPGAPAQGGAVSGSGMATPPPNPAPMSH